MTIHVSIVIPHAYVMRFTLFLGQHLNVNIQPLQFPVLLAQQTLFFGN